MTGVAGNAAWLAFIIAALTAFLTAFSYAELSSAYPKAGGEYEYAKQAFGRKFGVVLGLVISVSGMVSGATVAVGFAGYFTQLFSLNIILAALGISLLLFLVNVSGIRQSSVVNIVFTVAEIGGLLFVIAAAAPYLGRVNLTELPPGGFSTLLRASALSFFAFMGFEEIVRLAEETKNPEKNIPKALFTAGAVVAVIYLSIAVCAVSAVDWQTLGKSKSPLADIARVGFGTYGALTVSLIALFSTSNTILSNMLGSSRIIFSMASEINFLKILSRVSERRRTPVFALIVIALVMAAFSLIGAIETIASVTNIFIFTAFFFVNLSVVVLRRRAPDASRPYRIPLNIRNIPIPSVAGMALTLILLGFNIRSLITGVL